MAKSQVITLPFVLLLWDYWPLGRMFANSAKLPGAFAPRSFLGDDQREAPVVLHLRG
jgi:hypothetical protein